MKKALDIRPIKRFIDSIVFAEKIDRNDLDENGAVYYCNGNDSTEFDYLANGRTCEFYVYYKNEWGAIKCTVNEYLLHAYVFDKDEPQKTINTYEHESPFDLHELCEFLQGSFDDKMLWDALVTEWELEKRGLILD